MHSSLCVSFAHKKSGPAVERKAEPRHVYANPTMPEICPILSLGIYWMCFPPEATASTASATAAAAAAAAAAASNPGYSDDGGEGLDNLVFPGSKQDNRFTKCLTRMMATEEGVNELAGRSVKIGAYSIRDGASTFCTSDPASCVNSFAVNLRAGVRIPGPLNGLVR